MDPKSTSALDPKLKEVYDRVMGTSTPQPTPPAANTTAPTAPSSPASPVEAKLSPTPTSLPPLPQAPLGATTPLGQSGQPTPPLGATTPLGAAPSEPKPVTPTPPTQPLGATAPLGSATPPATPLGAPASTTPTNQANKTAIDYAALAAKYATPVPTVGTDPGPRPAVVTPSTTTYGVVNGASAKPVAHDKDKAEKTDTKKSGGMKKILLILGIPILLVIYTIVWVFVFGLDISSILPI